MCEKVVEKKEKRKRLRKQSLGEEIWNAITHGLGAIAGIVGLVLLLVKSDEPREYVGSAIFGTGMILLYLMSCLYHAFRNDSKVKSVFKRFDHLSIYILIGGTFAPILLSYVDHTVGIIFFIIQWIIIVVGVVLKAINTSKFHKLHIILYLALGWSGVFFLGDLLKTPGLFICILGGGLVYSIGVLFYIGRMKYNHVMWHFFCLVATLIQFLGIYLFIL